MKGPNGIGWLIDIVAISVGSTGFNSPEVEPASHILALKADGTIWEWGSNQHLGASSGIHPGAKFLPALIENISNVIAIAAGAQHSLALKSDGTVWAWGNNYWGQLGDGTNINTEFPVQVIVGYLWGNPLYLMRIKAIAGGACPSTISQPGNPVFGVAAIRANSIALRSDGKVFAWGNNAKGQLGIGQIGNAKNIAIPAMSVSKIRSISNVSFHSIICNDVGNLLMVGNNTYGQLNDGNFGGNTNVYKLNK